MPASSPPIIPFGIAVVSMTSELNVSTTMVSMNGSNKATKPSEAGLSVCTAEWAIDAVPRPASLEKMARWKP